MVEKKSHLLNMGTHAIVTVARIHRAKEQRAGKSVRVYTDSFLTSEFDSTYIKPFRSNYLEATQNSFITHLLRQVFFSIRLRLLRQG